MKAIKKILVPLDGSTYSKKALNLAILMSKGKNTTITGIHIIHIPIKFSSKIKRQYDKNAAKIMKTASNAAKKAGVKFKERITINGYVGREIVNFAEGNQFDLIVMGSRGPNPIAEMFLGSVANYVVTKSKIPVLIAK